MTARLLALFDPVPDAVFHPVYAVPESEYRHDLVACEIPISRRPRWMEDSDWSDSLNRCDRVPSAEAAIRERLFGKYYRAMVSVAVLESDQEYTFMAIEVTAEKRRNFLVEMAAIVHRDRFLLVGYDNLYQFVYGHTDQGILHWMTTGSIGRPTRIFPDDFWEPDHLDISPLVRHMLCAYRQRAMMYRFPRTPPDTSQLSRVSNLLDVLDPEWVPYRGAMFCKYHAQDLVDAPIPSSRQPIQLSKEFKNTLFAVPEGWQRDPDGEYAVFHWYRERHPERIDDLDIGVVVFTHLHHRWQLVALAVHSIRDKGGCEAALLIDRQPNVPTMSSSSSSSPYALPKRKPAYAYLMVGTDVSHGFVHSNALDWLSTHGESGDQLFREQFWRETTKFTARKLYGILRSTYRGHANEFSINE